MKSIIKNMTALSIGVLSLAVVSAVQAGPGPRGGFRGGFGFHGGYGFRGYHGPRFSVGIGYGYRPYFGGYYGYGYPALGLSFGYLPYGYWPFYFGDDLYYGYDGVYYRQTDDNHYQVVAPPIGAEVPKLPSKKAKSIMINNEQYFELNGVYYKAITKDDGTTAYLIAGKDGVLNTDQNANGPKVGDVVNQLPDGCRDVTIANKIYHVSPDDVYYEEVYDGTSTTYRVVGVPTNQGSGNNNKPHQNNNQPIQNDQTGSDNQTHQMSQ